MAGFIDGVEARWGGAEGYALAAVADGGMGMAIGELQAVRAAFLAPTRRGGGGLSAKL